MPTTQASMTVKPTPSSGFDINVPIVIIGAGAAGLVGALSAKTAGGDVLVIEADAVPSGSTALSAGLIPAAGTRYQEQAGINDSFEFFAADIQAKAKGQNPQSLVETLAKNSGRTVDWLGETFHLPFSVVTDFDYPGHSRRRMHGLPSRAGRELVDRLRATCEEQGIDIVCSRRATTLFTSGNTITGVEVYGPDGFERIGCEALILACNGFGGNREMVARFMPEITNAVWFGHDGNTGDALTWGKDLGAEMMHLGAYQGHGNVAHPHGILITWAVITEGGIQVNKNGQRFWNEAQGYSEAARYVLEQEDGVVWTVFDQRIAGIARQFQDFQDAEGTGAIKTAGSLAELASKCDLPSYALTQTVEALPWGGEDSFGRAFGNTPLSPPYNAVRVTGALFHTQGGLNVDETARVKLNTGGTLSNLFAAGGAAVGVSGKSDSGYLSGNGLLSAVVLGRIAGAEAAQMTRKGQ